MWSDRDLDEFERQNGSVGGGGDVGGNDLLPRPPSPSSLDHMEHMDYYGHANGVLLRPSDPSAMMLVNGGNGECGGCVIGGGGGSGGRLQHHDNMMMMSPEEQKLSSSSTKGKGSRLLQKCARRFGLDDRGCYVACGLALIALFLLAVIVTMGACWPVSRLRHKGSLHFCSRPSCLQAAAGIVARQNSSLDPCKDFYSYACNGWSAREPIPASKSSTSTLEEMEEVIRIEKSRLITMASHEPSQFNSIEWKVQNFYQSCMSLSFIESDREKPLIKIINSLGGWDVLRSFNLYSWDSHRVLRELHAEHYVNAFFSIGVVSDVQEPSRNIIRVSPDGLGMPDRTYYHRLPDDPAVQAYQTFMKDSAQLFGASSPEAHKFSVDMFNFEKRISEITPGPDYMQNPTKTNNRISVKDLHTMSMNIPWLEIFKASYNDAPMSEETEVIIVSPQYAADIAVIMSTTDRGSLNNYLVWRLVQAYMPFLAKPFREVVDIYRKSMTGAQKPMERWEFCEETTERFFGHLLNSFFAQGQKYHLERQLLAKKLFDYIKHNVAKSISVSASYDYTSRRAAISKLKNMTVQIGTPDFLLDRKYLKLMYNHLLVQKTDFFQNIQYGVIFLRKREEMDLVSPSEESRWFDLLLDKKQVSYSAAANKVVVPELFLQAPLFHPGFPHAVNMGGLGVKLSEAVIEGVVGYGLLFDTSGLLQHPASSDAGGNYSGGGGIFTQPMAAFERSTKCLAEKYLQQGIDTPDYLQKCRRQSAVSVSALKQTLLSLEDILELEKGVLLPAMENYDPQSVFFLTYAQSLCSQQTFKRRDMDRTAGETLLNQEKLKGTLSQTPEHAHFFFCSFEEKATCSGII